MIPKIEIDEQTANFELSSHVIEKDYVLARPFSSTKFFALRSVTSRSRPATKSS